jgi:hypothetical protein
VLTLVILPTCPKFKPQCCQKKKKKKVNEFENIQVVQDEPTEHLMVPEKYVLKINNKQKAWEHVKKTKEPIRKSPQWPNLK